MAARNVASIGVSHRLRWWSAGAGRPDVWLGLALSILGTPSCAQAPPWQRAWVVESFDCPACSVEDKALLHGYLGEKVVISTKAFINPTYETCPVGPDYSDIQVRDPGNARQYLGRDRLPALSSDKPLAGQVRCAEAHGPPNVVARIVIDGRSAFLIHETGAVLKLR